MRSIENVFVLNLLGRKVFGKVRKTTDSNMTYFLLCNLALADLGNLLLPAFFTGFTLVYGRYSFSEVIKTKKLVDNNWYTMMINVVGWTSNICPMSAIFVVCIIAVRRAIALYYPFKYKECFKSVKVYAMVGASWLAALIVACLPFYVCDQYMYFPKYSSSIAYLGKYTMKNLSSVEYISFLMVITIICTTLPAVFITISSVAVIIRLATRRKIKYKIVTKKKNNVEEHAARTVTLIPIIFIICHMPLACRITHSFITEVLKLTHSTAPHNGHKMSPGTAHYVNLLFHFILLYLNSCINPLIYFTGSPKLRKQISQKVEDYTKRIGYLFGVSDKRDQGSHDSGDTLQSPQIATMITRMDLRSQIVDN